MPRRRVAGATRAVSWSSSQIFPLVGSIIRLIIRSDVVLPQPDGPTKTVIWPVGATRSRLSTATVPSGYCLVTPANLIIATPPCSLLFLGWDYRMQSGLSVDSVDAPRDEPSRSAGSALSLPRRAVGR